MEEDYAMRAAQEWLEMQNDENDAERGNCGVFVDIEAPKLAAIIHRYVAEDIDNINRTLMWS